MFKKITFILAIIVISGLSGIIADRYLFPRLATTKLFSKYDFLKKSTENITIINKTEQIYVREDYSVNKFTNQSLSAVVNILSYSDSDARNNYGDSFKNGTGVIVTSDGIIMTHASVITKGKYKVTTMDGNVYDGEFIGTDSWSNLSFIKIEASNLPVVSFGNSDEYEPGEKIIAVGNDMLEYQNKFSAGVLSNYDPAFSISGETLSTAEKAEGVFLADFGLENISAGSPIIDYSGQVIGIMGKVEKNGQNKYFQIPSNKVKNVLQKVIDKNLDSNPTLGIYYILLSKSYVLANNMPISDGAIIFSSSEQQGLAVIAGTPAAKAGLKIKDILVRIDEEKVNFANSPSNILYKYKKGDIVKFSIIREGVEKEIIVQL